LGPVPAVIAKLKGEYRYSLLLKATSAKVLHKAVHSMRMSVPKPGKGIRVTIDVDPTNML
jgi:primosomal protein N'